EAPCSSLRSLFFLKELVFLCCTISPLPVKPAARVFVHGCPLPLFCATGADISTESEPANFPSSSCAWSLIRYPASANSVTYLPTVFLCTPSASPMRSVLIAHPSRCERR